MSSTTSCASSTNATTEVSVSSPQLLPEERIRQHLLQVLIKDLGYPKSRIVVEKELNLLPHLIGKSVPKRRLDVLVYDQELKPLIVFECKATKVTRDALDQVLGYNHVINAPFVAVVGAGEVLACDAGGNAIGGLMKYEDLMAMRSRWTGEQAEVVIAYGVGDGSLQVDCEQLIWIAMDDDDAKAAPSRVTCTMKELLALKKALWKAVGKKRSWMVLDGVDASGVKAFVEEMITGIELILSKASHFGVHEVENVLQNLGQGYNGGALFGRYEGVPAVICGAGPSLDTELVKSLQGRALIFAGGAALPKVVDAGVTPSFGLGCDSNPKRECVEKGLELGMPFFYTADFCADVLQKVSGPKFWIRHTGSLEMERSLWCESGALDIGWTVGTMAASIAYAMGCNPIVLVGMDMAYDKGEGFEVIGKNGEQMKTRNDLMMSAKWLEELIAKDKQRRWIDATPRGLKIAGTVKDTLDFPELVLPALKKEPVEVGDASKMRESIERCQELAEDIEKDRHAQILLETEPFFVHLKALWDIFQNVMPRDDRLAEHLFYKRVMDGFRKLG